MSTDERKKLLVLACAADRAAWVRVCAPQPPQPLAMAGNVLKMLEPLTFLLPGRLGHWIRKAQFLTIIGRQLGSFL